jgi:fosfomycin resistance protein FosX
MSINGLSHITFVVSDLSRSAKLWCEGLGATEVYDSGDRKFSLYPEKFFLLGNIWIALMEAPTSEPSYRHVAFEAEEKEFPEFELRLRSLGVEIRPPRPRVEGEKHSLYFYDYDNNLLELHSGTLQSRLQAYSLRGRSGK